jgi:hypothetical protein
MKCMSVCVTDLVAETSVTAADALFVAWLDGETHVSVEPRGPALDGARRVCSCSCVGSVAVGVGVGIGIGGFGRSRTSASSGWRKARRVVFKVEVDGRSAADVCVASEGVVLYGFGRVKREECEWRAGGLFGALHLQDCLFNWMAFTCVNV